MDLENKTIVITGASSGLGKQLALDFARKGNNLALLARNEKELRKVKEECEKKQAIVKAFLCDVTKIEQVKKTAKFVLEDFGAIDILVNNAGIGIYKSFDKLSKEEINDQIFTNFFGTIYSTQEFLPSMLSKKHGFIVNIASMAGKISFANLSVYSATKHAVVGFSQALQLELHNKGVHVLLVCPAGMQTNFFANKSWDEHVHRMHPEKMMTAQFVSKKILKAIEKNKYELYLPLKENLVNFAKAILPSQFRKIQIRRQKKHKLDLGEMQ